MRNFLGLITLLLLYSCSTQIKQDNKSPGLDSIKFQRDTLSSVKKEKQLNDFDYICKGNEPFYQIYISEKQNKIYYYDPMKQDTIHYLYVKPKLKDGITMYSTLDKTSSYEMHISIKDETCSDGMSEKKYQHSAQITINNKTYKGCVIAYGEQIQ